MKILPLRLFGKDKHTRCGAISRWRTSIAEKNRKSRRVSMATAPVFYGDLRHIGAVLFRAQTKVAPPVVIIPDQAEWPAGRQLLADLTRQDCALHARHRLSFELDSDRMTDDLLHQFVFEPENGPPLPFEDVLLQGIPDFEIIGVGVQSRADLAACGELPHPKVFILHIMQEPGGRRTVSPLPGKDRAAFLEIEMYVRQAAQGFLSRDMVIQYLKGRRFFRHLLQDRTRITEIDDHNFTAGATDRGRMSMIGRNELSRGEPLPNGVRSAESVGALGVVENQIGDHYPVAYHDFAERKKGTLDKQTFPYATLASCKCTRRYHKFPSPRMPLRTCAAKSSPGWEAGRWTWHSLSFRPTIPTQPTSSSRRSMTVSIPQSCSVARLKA